MTQAGLDDLRAEAAQDELLDVFILRRAFQLDDDGLNGAIARIDDPLAQCLSARDGLRRAMEPGVRIERRRGLRPAATLLPYRVDDRKRIRRRGVRESRQGNDCKRDADSKQLHGPALSQSPGDHLTKRCWKRVAARSAASQRLFIAIAAAHRLCHSVPERIRFSNWSASATKGVKAHLQTAVKCD
ncbi:MAG TPA: hypothetical protein VFR86_13460 [Burkholderiaceae bacterium]|nr:hypothetical protein [Burkholderiaceae bacterium]